MPQDLTAEDLQLQMRLVRSEMESDAQELVADAQSMISQARGWMDWKHYVSRFPWISLGAAGVFGYWLVPQIPRVVEANPSDLERLARSRKLVLAVTPASARPETPQGMASRLLGPLLNVAAGLVAQKGMSFLDQQLKHAWAVAGSNGRAGTSEHDGHD